MVRGVAHVAEDHRQVALEVVAVALEAPEVEEEQGEVASEVAQEAVVDFEEEEESQYSTVKDWPSKKKRKSRQVD